MGVLVFLDDYRDRPISLGAAARRYVEAMMRSEGTGRAVNPGTVSRHAMDGDRGGIEDKTSPPARPVFPRDDRRPGG